MKVLHVIPSVAPRYGGPSFAVVGICSALAQEGVEVLLAATDADGPGRLPVETGRCTDWKGVSAIFFPRWAGESLKFSPALATWLRRRVAPFDLVHVHSVFSHSSVAAGSACVAAGIPFVVRPLGQLDEWSLSQGRWRKQLFLVGPARRLLRNATALHWTADAERVAAASIARGLPGFVSPLGVDEELFGLERVPEAEPRVLALSRLHPKKNLEALIDAFLDVSRAPWKLVIAGGGDEEYAESLKRLVSDRGGADRVVFSGWIEGERKLCAFREAELFALPSHQENFGIAVAEAMAAGLPVLVSEAVNLAGDVRARGAGWVVSLTRDGLRSGLREAFASAEERSRRGEAGRALAESKFRWGAVARQLVAEYERILREGRAA